MSMNTIKMRAIATMVKISLVLQTRIFLDRGRHYSGGGGGEGYRGDGYRGDRDRDRDRSQSPR